jgi:N-acyl-D-glutamate deacylase
LSWSPGRPPIADWYELQAQKNLPIHYGAAAGWTFARIATFTGTKPEATSKYFQDAQSRMDWKMNIATPEQQEQILKLVEQGLDEGALGIGINAGYAPGYGQKEYFALASLPPNGTWQPSPTSAMPAIWSPKVHLKQSRS